MDPGRRALLRTGVPLVTQVARRMSTYLWHRPPESDLACLGMLTLHDAALRHDPERAAFEPYLVGRLRWAMISDSRRRARRAKLLASSRPPPTTAVLVRRGLGAASPEKGEAQSADDEPCEPESRDDACPELAHEWKRWRTELGRALGELPSRMRQVMVRHYFGGERLDAVAGDLGMSKAGVTRLHMSGKRRLAVRLRGMLPTPWRLSGPGGARS